MISSGIKRGLAATAISALAITGVPAVAFATSLEAQSTADTAALQTVTANGQAVSVENDGTNTTVSLVATAGAGVEYIQFKYNATNIGSPVARSANGDFQLEWTVPAALYNTTVSLTAQPSLADGTNSGGTASTFTGITVSPTADAVEIAPKAGGLGYFTQPGASPTTPAGAADYFGQDGLVAGITGTTSAVGGNVTLTNGLGLASGSTVAADPVAAPADTTTTFAGTVEIDGGTITTGAGAVNQVEVRGSTGASNDAQGYNVYGQTIAGITATPAKANIPGGTTSVTVKVTDQNGAAVAGAHVAAITESGSTSPGTTTDAFTNGRGEVVFTGVTAGAHNYYVDATNVAGFTNGFDRTASATVTSFTPRATTLTFTSKDGSAFDFDEFENGGGSHDSDLLVQVKDQNGNALAGEFFFYSLAYTPFEPSATNQAQNFTGTLQTDSAGYAELTLPAYNALNADQLGDGGTGGSFALSGYVNRDGSAPGQDPTDLALDPSTFKAGESDAAWDASGTTTAQVGSTQTFGGSLTLDDGTALAGRTLDVTYSPGADSALSTTQPAGTTRLSATSARVVTDASGKYSVSVTDPTLATPAAENGTLTVKGTNTVGSGATLANGVGTDAMDTLNVVWSLNAAPFAIYSTGNNDLFGDATPGRPVDVSFVVENAQGAPLAGQTVTLKVDHGFFTPYAATAGDLTPAAAPAAGALFGAWKNLGDTITVTTDGSGVATATVAIEKDAGFDDDGQVRTVVTATAGTVTSNDANSSPIVVNWDSENPLNSGGLEVAQSDEQTVSILPDAPTNEGVYYDVQAKDQFGNLVDDEDVDVTTDLGEIEDETNNNNGIQTGTDDTNPEFSLWSDDAGDATPTGSWTTDKTTYVDGDLATPGFQPSVSTVNQNVTDDGETVSFYDIDFAASTYTLTHDTADSVKVGTTVIETYTAVDQKGEPISGVDVEFFRSGPDTGQDGEENEAGTTGQDGSVTYVFSGTKKGTATISALITDTNIGSGGAAAGSRANDQVTFIGDAVPPAYINLGLSNAGSNGSKDKIKVNANGKAAGLTAVLYKNGKRVASHKLNGSGDFTFTVKDTNGKSKTKYTVKVASTSSTKAATKSIKIK